MSTTIDSLNIRIEASAGNAAYQINQLATALNGLRSNSKLTATVNGLTKLSTALNNLNGPLNGLNLAKLNSIRGTFAGLANIKITGLNSALNTLKKLPEIVNGLDEVVLARFSMQMERLATALGPVATQIAAVGTAFARLPANLRRVVTATNHVGQTVDNLGGNLHAGAINVASFTTALNNLMGYARQVVQALSNTIAVAVEWDGIQYRFGRAFGEDAEEVYAHVERINKVMGISTQEFMQYSSLYGSLLSGFGMAQEKVTTISVGLTELSYDIWAAYNDRFKSLEQASEAVRSAITGEIEPIRNAGIALTEASLQEYLDNIGMATVSIEKLSEAQKAEVRYAAMVNAAMQQGIVGTYAKEMHTAEGAVRSLKQSLKALSQAFGSLFIPVLQVVVPYLTAFVELLTEAVHWIANFFGLELFSIDWSSSSSGMGGLADSAGDAASSLGSAAGAAKKLQDYTMGFDELNVIQPSSSGGGAGGGAGNGWGDGLLDLDTLWDEGVFAAASKQIEKLKEKLRPAFDWIKENGTDILDIVTAIGGGFLAWKITTSFATSIKNIVDALKDKSFLSSVTKIAAGITLMVTGVTLSYSGGYGLGHDGPTLMNVIKTALGAALSVAGSLLVFGTGPVGWTVGIGLALTATIVGFTVGAKERLIEDEIKARFGTIDLSNELIEVWVDKITAVPRELEISTSENAVTFDVALDMFSTEKLAADGLHEAVQKAIDSIETMDYKIALGLEVDPEKYQDAITTLVEKSQSYLDQYYLTTSIAVSFLGGEAGGSLNATLTAFYTDNSAKLADLGEKLKEAVSGAFVDGEWIPDKLNEAKEIQAEIQEVLEYASDVEFRAKLQGLKIEAAGTELTFESFQAVLDGASEAITEKLEALDEIKMSQLQVAVMEYDALIEKGVAEKEAKRFLEDRTAEIENEYREAKLELEYGTYEFGLETLQSHFADALKTARAGGLLDFNTLLADIVSFDPGYIFDDGSGEVYGNISAAVADLSYYYTSGLSKIEPEVRGAIEDTISAMKPSKEEYDDLAKTYREAGQTVPEELRKGLSDYNELAALTKDADAINYKIGEAFSTDSAFLNTLATVEDAGKQLDENMAAGLLNNVNIIRDEATGVVTEIESAITGERIKVTPELIDNFAQLGMDISDGLLGGAEKGAKDKKSSWLDWAIWPWNWFKEKNEIRSPSKLFARGGKYLADGLLSGITDGWKSIKSWFNTNITPKLTLTYWQDKFKNISKGLGDKLDEAWKKVKDFFDVSEWKKKVTDAIGAIKDNFKLPELPKIKLSVAWDTNVGTVKKAVYEALGLQGWPNLSWSTYAAGGFPSMGEIFISREAGPELVGRIGNRTAVANNDQIVAAVSQGVYSAVRAAMGGDGGSGQSVNVYLDGKQIYTSVRKTESERGVRLMGSQLGYAY